MINTDLSELSGKVDKMGIKNVYYGSVSVGSWGTVTVTHPKVDLNKSFIITNQYGSSRDSGFNGQRTSTSFQVVSADGGNVGWQLIEFY